jgi:ABC-2 type transport system ATP-binding protein
MYAVKTAKLTKRYKNITATDKLDLEIKKGEFFSLLGLNGAGKTTTVKMLTCVTQPTEGDANVGGYSITAEAQEVKGIIGASPQKTAVAPNLSVKENLEFMCRLYGFSSEKTGRKIKEMTEQLSLGEVLDRKTGKLSGGWGRRVSIAMALICEPEILFLDEPTLGLDVIARRELWDTLCKMRGRMTVVMTTHYMEEAEALSDRIGIMKGGRLLAVGNVAELKEKTGAQNLEAAFISIVGGDVL